MMPILLIGICSAVSLYLWGDRLSFEALRDNRELLLNWRDQNYFLAASVYAAAYVLVVAFSLPGASPMTLAGGFLFGVMAGGTMTVMAATSGATIIFLAARVGPGGLLYASLVDRGGDGMLGRIERGLRENEVSYLLLVRLVPAVPFFVANLAPAFLGVSLRNFVLTTFFGIIPATFIFAWIGSGLGDVFARGETPDPGLLLDPVVLGPLLALIALAALPIAVKVVRRKEVPPR